MHLLPGWHPLVVHFPLALIVVATLCLSLARTWPGARLSQTLATVGTWNLCIGGVLVFVALGTGLAATVGLQAGTAARAALSLHVKAAVVTTLLVLLASVWRGAGNAAESRPSTLLLVVLWAATLALTVTGYRGGQNVYRYGIGVAVDSSAVNGGARRP